MVVDSTHPLRVIRFLRTVRHARKARHARPRLIVRHFLHYLKVSASYIRIVCLYYLEHRVSVSKI